MAGRLAALMASWMVVSLAGSMAGYWADSCDECLFQGWLILDLAVSYTGSFSLQQCGIIDPHQIESRYLQS